MLLVIGASGTIGSALYRKAVSRNIAVVGTCTKEREGLIPFLLGIDKPQDLIKKLEPMMHEECSAVIAAAKTNLRFCYENPDSSYEINVRATQELILLLQAYGIGIVYLSSDAVFDGVYGDYDETSEIHPLSVYGKHKAAMENFIEERFPDALIYRLPKIVNDKPVGNHLFMDFYRSYQNRLPIHCISGLKFNPTFLDDVTSCILLGIHKKLRGIYHVANSENYTRAQLAKEFLLEQDERCFVSESDANEWSFVEPKPLDTTMRTIKFQDAVGGIKFIPMKDIIRKFWSNVRSDSGASV